MTELTHKKCQPCEKGTPPVPPERVQQLLAQVSGWEVVEGKLLRKQLKLADFMSVITLVNRIAGVAEAEDHHPDLHITGYRRLMIELATHAIGGLSDNDFILAAKIDALSTLPTPGASTILDREDVEGGTT